MYLIETFKKFFHEDKSLDLYYFIIGLIFLYSFAIITMYEWTWIITLSVSILLSALFRYITVDELYHKEFRDLKNPFSILDYALSKNIFSILFTSFILSLVMIILNMLHIFSFIDKIPIAIDIIITQSLLVLGTENIILIFNNKMIESYDVGIKRDEEKDISIGIDNIKSLFPSIFINVIFTVLIFYFKVDFKIYRLIIYFLLCIFIFVLYNSAKRIRKN